MEQSVVKLGGFKGKVMLSRGSLFYLEAVQEESAVKIFDAAYYKILYLAKVT